MACEFSRRSWERPKWTRQIQLTRHRSTEETATLREFWKPAEKCPWIFRRLLIRACWSEKATYSQEKNHPKELEGTSAHAGIGTVPVHNHLDWKTWRSQHFGQKIRKDTSRKIDRWQVSTRKDTLCHKLLGNCKLKSQHDTTTHLLELAKTERLALSSGTKNVEKLNFHALSDRGKTVQLLWKTGWQFHVIQPFYYWVFAQVNIKHVFKYLYTHSPLLKIYISEK